MQNTNIKTVIESMKSRASETQARWSKQINGVNKALESSGQPKMDDWKQITLANILETYATRSALQQEQVRVNGANEAVTQPANVSFAMRHGINILTASMASLISHDIISIQPLN